MDMQKADLIWRFSLLIEDMEKATGQQLPRLRESFFAFLRFDLGGNAAEMQKHARAESSKNSPGTDTHPRARACSTAQKENDTLSDEPESSLTDLNLKPKKPSIH